MKNVFKNKIIELIHARKIKVLYDDNYFDCYSLYVRVDDPKKPDKISKNFEMYGFSTMPFMPNGFNQYCGDFYGSYKSIKLSGSMQAGRSHILCDMNDEVAQAICQRALPDKEYDELRKQFLSSRQVVSNQAS